MKTHTQKLKATQSFGYIITKAQKRIKIKCFYTLHALIIIHIQYILYSSRRRGRIEALSKKKKNNKNFKRVADTLSLFVDQHS